MTRPVSFSSGQEARAADLNVLADAVGDALPAVQKGAPGGVATLTTPGGRIAPGQRAPALPRRLVTIGHSLGAGPPRTSGDWVSSKLAMLMGAVDDNIAVGGSAMSSPLSNTSGTPNRFGGWSDVMQRLPVGERNAPFEALWGCVLVMSGLNDAAYLGADRLGTTWRQSMRAVISWLRAGSVYDWNSTTVAYGGSWAPVFGPKPDSSGGSGSNLTNSNGATVTISVPASFPGGTISLGFIAGHSTAGADQATVGVQVDSAAEQSVDLRALTAAEAVPFAVPIVHRLNGVAAGAHTIVITNRSSKVLVFDHWMIEAPEPPLIVVPKSHVPSNQSYYPANWPGGTPSAATVDTINANVDALVSEFGSRVVTFPVADLLNGAENQHPGPAQGGTDGIHPHARASARVAARGLETVVAADVPSEVLARAGQADAFGPPAIARHTLRPVRRSGGWRGPQGVVASASPGVNVLTLVPAWFAESEYVDALTMNVAVAAGAGGVARLGIYADGGVGLPASLLMEASATVATTATGKKQADLPFPVYPGGLAWLACVQQVAAANITCMTGGVFLPGGLTDDPAQVSCGWQAAGGPHSGALPALVVPTAVASAARVLGRTIAA